jgi:hypothetical protein
MLSQKKRENRNVKTSTGEVELSPHHHKDALEEIAI